MIGIVCAFFHTEGKGFYSNFKLAELGKKYAPEGYAYKNAKASNKTTTINYISFNSTGGSGYGWYCIKENENNWTRVSRSSTYSIYLVYEPVSAWIKDDIMNTGNLIPETNDSIKPANKKSRLN